MSDSLGHNKQVLQLVSDLAADLRDPGFRLLPASEILSRQGVEIEGDMLRLLPHRHATDGFFAAALERVA